MYQELTILKCSVHHYFSNHLGRGPFFPQSIMIFQKCNKNKLLNKITSKKEAQLFIIKFHRIKLHSQITFIMF